MREISLYLAVSAAIAVVWLSAAPPSEPAPAVAGVAVVERLPAGTIVYVALVEDGLTADIRGDENRGWKLTHDRAVRAFYSTAIDDTGRAAVGLSTPLDVQIDRSTFILIAQRPADAQPLAAAEVKIPR